MLQKTPWECMTVSHNLIWMFSEPLSGLILFTVSIDRLLSVTFPLHYIRWSNMYIAVSFGATFIWPFITSFVLGLILGYEARDETKHIKEASICWSPVGMTGLNDYYVTYQRWFNIVFATASIITYGLVWLKYRQHQNKVSHHDQFSQC